MSPERWQQINRLLGSVLELEVSQRTAFLDQACAGDEELRREVDSLLKFDGRGDRFIEEPAVDLAAKMMAEEPQSLIGRQFGSYEIVSLLGAGGMGVVYQARDTRLKRSVAIKVLPRDRMSDPERKRRFIQEARAASALNHPNIITIHDIGNENDIDFIVMEYVAGKTLDQYIPNTGMRLGEALKLAIQMAGALARAHSAGIIHRDLKPTNVMVTDDGLVKVLDFGLAKLTEASGSREDGTRMFQSETEEGMIIGTLSYMSPEQAEGKKVDARSDVFSFGAVLYEMITGQKAFEGDSKVSTLAAIVKQEPKAISQVVLGIPADLEKIVNRCLRKDPERRFQHMADARVALQELKEESDSSSLATAPALARPTRRSWVWAGAAFVFVGMAIAAWLFHGGPRKPQAAPELVPLTSYAGNEDTPNFSPDGNQVAFSWNGEKQDNFDIYIKMIGSPTPVRLTTDTAPDFSPAFSPDGRWIGFMRGLNKRVAFIIIPAIGGPERIVADLPESVFSFAWFPDSKWVVTDGLMLLSTESGDTRSLTSPPVKSQPDVSPAVSPDGRTVAFSRSQNSQVTGGFSDLYLLDLTEDLKPKGEPRRLTFLKRSSSQPVWTPNGREIIFASGFIDTEMRLWKVAASGSGEPERLPSIGDAVCCPAISRNGNRLAYQQGVINTNIWRLSLLGPGVASGSPARFITSTRWDTDAQYSPDGKRIAFECDRGGVHGVWVSDADGSKAMELFSQGG